MQPAERGKPDDTEPLGAGMTLRREHGRGEHRSGSAPSCLINLGYPVRRGSREAMVALLTDETVSCTQMHAGVQFRRKPCIAGDRKRQAARATQPGHGRGQRYPSRHAVMPEDDAARTMRQ